MPADVTVYTLKSNHRSRIIGDFIAQGAMRAGDRVKVTDSRNFVRPETPVCAFYCYESNTPHIMASYIKAGLKVVFADLGYWGRRDGGRYEGFHKLVINDRHATRYFQKRNHDKSRIEGKQILPWRRHGRFILVAGMSAKAARAVGMNPQEWEKATIARLKRITQRQLFYRPKPGRDKFKPIAGTSFQYLRSPDEIFKHCHAVVARHSNFCIDAILAGVPIFCEGGVSLPMGTDDLERIDKPIFPANREQWLANVSWTQFRGEEIRSGFAWDHLKSEGLIP